MRCHNNKNTRQKKKESDKQRRGDALRANARQCVVTKTKILDSVKKKIVSCVNATNCIPEGQGIDFVPCCCTNYALFFFLTILLRVLVYVLYVFHLLFFFCECICVRLVGIACGVNATNCIPEGQ